MAFSAILAAALPLAASAAFSVGEGQIDVNATVKGEYNSDVLQNNTELSDFVTDFTPELEFIHDKGLINLDLAGGVLFEEYDKHTIYNAVDPYGKGTLKWLDDQDKMDFKLTASYTRSTQPNEFINNIATSNDSLVNATFTHYATEKIGYRLHFDYTGTAYVQGSSFLDSVYSPRYGGDIFYTYSPKLEGFLRYDYRESHLSYPNPGSVNVNSKDDQFLVGVKGELLPKLRGQVAVGYVDRKFDQGGAKQSGLLIDTRVDWSFLPDSTLGVYANHDFNSSPTDQSIKAFITGIDLTETINPKVIVTAGVFYSNDIYTGSLAEVTQRVDNSDGANISLAYKFTETLSGNLFYTYEKTRSTATVSTYNQDIVGLSLTAKF